MDNVQVPLRYNVTQSAVATKLNFIIEQGSNAAEAHLNFYLLQC